MTNPFLAAQAASQTPAETPAPAPAADQPAPAPAAAPAQNFGTPSGAAASPSSLFASAPSGDGDRLKDDLGAFVVVRVDEVKRGMMTQASDQPVDAIDATWLVCDGPNAGTTRNGLIFGRALVPGLIKNHGNNIPFTVGTVAHAAAKPGRSAALILEDATSEQLQLAQQCVTAVGWV